MYFFLIIAFAHLIYLSNSFFLIFINFCKKEVNRGLFWNLSYRFLALLTGARLDIIFSISSQKLRKERLQFLFSVCVVFRQFVNLNQQKMFHYQRFSSAELTRLNKVNVHNGRTQEQGVIVADDLNKLLLSLLRYFAKKTVRYCRRNYQVVFWWL